MSCVEQKRRELFEASLYRDWDSHLVFLDRDGDGYVFGDINSAWWGFNAALDEVEIDLQHAERTKEGGGISGTMWTHEVRDAIESTGLGLKVK